MTGSEFPGVSQLTIFPPPRGKYRTRRGRGEAAVAYRPPIRKHDCCCELTK